MQTLRMRISVKSANDIMEVITRAGADAATVDISIEIDSQKNILRAIATGATELRTKGPQCKDHHRRKNRSRILADAEKTTTDMVSGQQRQEDGMRNYVNDGKRRLSRII